MRLYEIFRRDPEDKGRFGKPEPWRGPHEGRKVELMLAGKKPAAWLFDYDNEMVKFQPYIDNGTLSAIEFRYKKSGHFPDLKGYVVTLPGEEWRADKLQKLYDAHDKYYNTGKEELWHARIGILLGYSNKQIHSFLASY